MTKRKSGHSDAEGVELLVVGGILKPEDNEEADDQDNDHEEADFARDKLESRQQIFQTEEKRNSNMSKSRSSIKTTELQV